MNIRSIATLKSAYRIPAAWRDLGLDGSPGKICSSPFRTDDNPSFGLFADNTRWHDFGTGETGDVIDFVAKARGCDAAAAMRFIEERLGLAHEFRTGDRQHSAKWPALRRGTASELASLNKQRGFAFAAMHDAESRGLLHFGTQWSCGFWAITDSRRAIIELRRITGESWRAYGRLPERKAHCLGTGKNWPVGIIESEPFSKIAFCEGAPDLIAALSLACAEGKTETIAPTAMLGAATGKIAAEALRYFKGKHVRLFPHVDTAGWKALRRWAQQIRDAGVAKLDAFDLSKLVRDDGQPGKDLADVCRIDHDCFERHPKFWELLP
jgi:hypothetical protein